MKNIIIVGDSFCACDAGWPGTLSNMVQLKLLHCGLPGQHWWGNAVFLDSLSQEDIDNCSVIIIVHTSGQRIPNHSNLELRGVLPDYAREIPLAKSLYYKYIHDGEFLDWAQKQWFRQISEQWKHTKLIHLHAFSFSLDNSRYLGGVNVFPTLTSISVNEVGDPTAAYENDIRLNHLNAHNNNEMALQLFDIIQNYQIGEVHLDIAKFDQLTDKWDSWGIRGVS